MNKITSSVMLFWLLVVFGSYWWNMTDHRHANHRLAIETARAFFQQIISTRAWNALHGGVYVPVSQHAQPNPYLEGPLRDLVTDKGVRLTRINPAYMTRQISEISSQHKYGIQFHITSLKPIRPANKATPWEKKWLQSFNNGQKEAGQFFNEGANSGFRYMAPLVTKASCLKCHAKQGYKEGDIRGGISVTLPHFSDKISPSLVIGYSLAASFGVLLIFISGRLLDKKRLLLIQANQALKTESAERQRTITSLQEANDQVKQLSGIVPICMHCKEIRDDKGYWSNLENFIAKHTEAEFSHGICEACLKKHYPENEI